MWSDDNLCNSLDPDQARRNVGQKAENDGDDNDEDEDNDDSATNLTTTNTCMMMVTTFRGNRHRLLYKHRLLCFICIVLMRNSKLTLSNSDVPCRIKLI